MKTIQYYPVLTNYVKSFPFYVCTIGVSQRQEPICRPSGMEQYQLLYTVCGEGRVEADGKIYPLKPHTILFSPKNTLHCYYGYTEDWQTKWITFGGSGADMFRDRGTEIWELPEAFSFQDYHFRIMRLRETEEWEIKSSVILYELLLNCRDFSSTMQTSVYSLKNRLEPVINYIYVHFREDLDLSSLASEIGVTEEHFCRIFKEFAGIRPFEYITDLRIQTAKTILFENPEQKIEDVARECGYHSTSYFIKKFKEREHMPPQKYRAMILNTAALGEKTPRNRSR